MPRTRNHIVVDLPPALLQSLKDRVTSLNTTVSKYVRMVLQASLEDRQCVVPPPSQPIAPSPINHDCPF